MSQGQGSGEKTEPATPKRLREARKKGDVAKSKDVSGTLGFAFITTLIFMAMGHISDQLGELIISAIQFIDAPFAMASQQLGMMALYSFLMVSALVLLPVALFGMLVEFLQTGPVFAMDKLTPKLSNLNPGSGIKKMFSMDNLVELIKSTGKTLILGVIAWLTIGNSLNQLVLLPSGNVPSIISAISHMIIELLGWTLGIFLIFMAMDAAYQHHAYAKKMRMSVQDIKKEHKDNEGDPQLKGQRRQLQQEWSQESATQAARQASVLVVNPTHIAIAIRYDKYDTPVPIVSAKGEDENARAMRDAANESNVPVLRNQPLARQLLADVDEGDVVPRELFDIVAQVILWARHTAEKMDPNQHLRHYGSPSQQPPDAPGEDLTHYPASINLFDSSNGS